MADTQMGYICYRNCPSCGWDATLLQITPDKWVCEKCGYKEVTVHVDTEQEPMYELLPQKAIREVARLMTKMEGGNGGKHESGAWKKMNVTCHLSHLYDHLMLCSSYEDGGFDGNNLDDESGMSHLAHLAARALMALEVWMEQQDKSWE